MNLSKIKFGITKVFCTFEVPNTLQVAEHATDDLVAFFMPLSKYRYCFLEKRCRNSRDGLNTIVPPVGIRQRKVRHRFLLHKMPKIHSKMNNQIEMPSLKDEAHLPEALQSALSDYFLFNGTLADIEANLWTMLETATAGCQEVGLSAKDVLEFMMLYKSTKALVLVLHSYHTKTTVELCNN